MIYFRPLSSNKRAISSPSPLLSALRLTMLLLVLGRLFLPPPPPLARFLLPALTLYLPLKAALPAGSFLFAAHHMNLQV